MYPDSLKRTYERFSDLRRDNPWLWEAIDFPPYTVEWMAYKTLSLMSDYDGKLIVRISSNRKSISVKISAERELEQPNVGQAIKIENGKIIENEIWGKKLGESPFEHYKFYFMKLPKEVIELLTPIF